MLMYRPISVLLLCATGLSQLVVNVKNEGGEVLTETIVANTTLDTVSLTLKQNDGTIITQLVDFKNVRCFFLFLFAFHNDNGLA